MAVQENIDPVNSPEEAKRRLREFGERHDAGNSAWMPLLKAAAAGAGVAAAARVLRGARRSGAAGTLTGLLLAARILAPLVLALLAGQRAKRSRAPRPGARPSGGSHRQTPNGVPWLRATAPQRLSRD